MPNFRIHDEAQEEYEEAADWFFARNPMTMRQFVAAVEQVFRTLTTNPAFYGWHDAEYREAVLVRFPYSVIYRVDAAGNVLVVAVAHASRKPG